MIVVLPAQYLSQHCFLRTKGGEEVMSQESSAKLNAGHGTTSTDEIELKDAYPSVVLKTIRRPDERAVG